MNTKNVASIVDSQSENYIWQLEAYCSVTNCPVRQVHIRAKDHDNDFAKRLRRRRALVCPLCSGPLTIHWVLSAAGERQRSERNARMSVNAQMWDRDHGGEGMFPSNMLCDERLPPTPPDWWPNE